MPIIHSVAVGSLEMADPGSTTYAPPMVSILRKTTLWMCGLSLFGAAVCPALSGETGDAPTPVRVYTNADLERFQLPADSVTVEAADPLEGWEFVTSYLDREHGRIDAERAYELELARLEEERTRLTTGYVSIPYVPFRYGRHGRAYRRSPPHGRPTPYGFGGSVQFGGTRPLHAGPTHAQIHRARAMRYKGSDAFPTRP